MKQDQQTTTSHPFAVPGHSSLMWLFGSLWLYLENSFDQLLCLYSGGLGKRPPKVAQGPQSGHIEQAESVLVNSPLYSKWHPSNMTS